MSESSKRAAGAAGVGGGYRGLSGSPRLPLSYLTGNLSGQDGTGYEPTSKPTDTAQNDRIEQSDTLRRRRVGFRGL